MKAAHAHAQADGEPLAAVLRPRGPVHVDLNEAATPDGTVIWARGELDLLTARRLARSLDSVLRGREGDVVVDLTETQFLDSAALRVLLHAQGQLARRSRQLRVLCGEGPVRRVIAMARLLETLNLAEPDPTSNQAA